jgi:DNA ligase-1
VRRFAQLFHELDATTRTSEKVRALEAYFRESSAEDAAAALSVLSGHRQRRGVTTTLLRQWAAEAAGIPAWLLEESYAAVGDLAETVALVLPDAEPDGALQGLAATIAETIAPLAAASVEEKRRIVQGAWQRLRKDERVVWHKLITGGFRVGVAKTLVARALAEIAEVDPATMAHRLMGLASVTPEAYLALFDAETTAANPSRPYPFFLASPLEAAAESLGDVSTWIAEWKWDGMRAQLIRRGDVRVLWTRGEELASEAFPELIAASENLPDGCVLDGEVLAWKDGELLGFQSLSRRAGRRRVTAKQLREIPCVFVAYDLLELDGCDLRELPLSRRREQLAGLGLPPFGGPGSLSAVAPPPDDEREPPRLFLSPQVPARSWSDLTQARDSSRQRGVEGLMLKRLTSPYRVGRPRGDWWKWKVGPLEVDAVLLYAQAGHGRRASLHTDYTLGVWDGDTLVPAAKAYSGLTDDEIAEVDRIIRQTTRERHGPVRVVEPTLVFQLAFDAIAASSRHKSGVAMRFPRIARWRRDKQPADAGRLEELRALLPPARQAGAP